jgi:UDP-N-acetylmuramyl-tripeptide synthetase
MKVVAITGTNGKTTTSLLTAELLKAGGKKVGLSSTTTFEIAGKGRPNLTNRTNLGRWKFIKLASEMRKAGCEYLVLEASSEGIVQHRLWGVPIDVAVFTNLTPDHLNTHGNMTNYRLAKEKIFHRLLKSRRLPDMAKVSVINIDDSVAPEFTKHPADRKLSYGVEGRADYKATEIKLESGRSKFTLEAEGEKYPMELSLSGRFNIENALAAISVARSQGVEWKAITKVLKGSITVPGRVEDVVTGKGFRVVVDYAHSEDALQKLYETLRSETKGRLIAVLGACGDRDKAKRPVLGEIAGKMCDLVVITDEEPYHEDPEVIRAAVASGVKGKAEGKNLFVVPDRRKGIRKGLEEAVAGDIVVVTGMGHQRYMTIGDKKIPWRDQEVIKEELRTKK